MPDAFGYLTNRDTARIQRMAQSGFHTKDIAEVIGCHEDTVRRYSGSLAHRRVTALRYSRWVTRAAAYVPTFGGGQ